MAARLPLGRHRLAVPPPGATSLALTVARFRQRRAEASTITPPDWEAVPLVPDVPEVPDGLSDRAMGSSEPLLSIADAAGGDWPARARAAAIALSGGDRVAGSVGVALLKDVDDVMRGRCRLSSHDLLDRLHGIEDAAWGDLYGKPSQARRLASLSEPYGITPRQERVDGEVVHGYFRQDFEDAWRQYVPGHQAPPETPGTNGTGDSVEDDYPARAWEP